MIYPPRPTIRAHHSLKFKDYKEWSAQAKFNGSNCICNYGMSLDRYGKVQPKWTNEVMQELDGVFFGEFMNKGGLYEGFQYIIYDAMEIESKSLIGLTFAERYKRLSGHFRCSTIDQPSFVARIKGNVGLATVKTKKLKKVYEEAIQHKMLEGIVMKRNESKLRRCTNKHSNNAWQVKIRKPHKCYAL